MVHGNYRLNSLVNHIHHGRAELDLTNGLLVLNLAKVNYQLARQYRKRVLTLLESRLAIVLFYGSRILEAGGFSGIGGGRFYGTGYYGGGGLGLVLIILLVLLLLGRI